MRHIASLASVTGVSAPRRFARVALLLAVAAAAPAGGQAPEPVRYTIRVPDPAAQLARIEASIPTGGRSSVELMMPVWSPGYYRVQDYAGEVLELTARTADGERLEVERTSPNRWRVATNGDFRVVIDYALRCDRRSVTTNWISPDLGVLNGPATYITLAEPPETGRPHEVRLERPPAWKSAATALPPAPNGVPDHWRAPDYDALADAPIVAGDLAIHTIEVAGVPHELVDVGDRPASWDGAEVAEDLGAVVRASLPLWGQLPYDRYVFLNVFRRGGGGLEHAASTLLTTNAEGVATPEGYRRWLAFAAHEYVHALNVKRLRPVELGPFDYETPPRTPSLWLSEGGTSYYANLLLARAGLVDADGFLAAISQTIRGLQTSPGRLLQTLEQSSLEVWTNSNSGVAAAPTTVSYYIKGSVVAFLLDARVRVATDGRRSLDDVMRLSLRRYGGERGFTPEEFRATAEEVAGTDLDPWFERTLASTKELDYGEALAWYGLRWADDGSWTLEVRDDASADQSAHLAALLEPGRAGS